MYYFLIGVLCLVTMSTGLPLPQPPVPGSPGIFPPGPGMSPGLSPGMDLGMGQGNGRPPVVPCDKSTWQEPEMPDYLVALGFEPMDEYDMAVMNNACPALDCPYMNCPCEMEDSYMPSSRCKSEGKLIMCKGCQQCSCGKPDGTPSNPPGTPSRPDGTPSRPSTETSTTAEIYTTRSPTTTSTTTTTPPTTTTTTTTPPPTTTTTTPPPTTTTTTTPPTSTTTPPTTTTTPPTTTTTASTTSTESEKPGKGKGREQGGNGAEDGIDAQPVFGRPPLDVPSHDPNMVNPFETSDLLPLWMNENVGVISPMDLEMDFFKDDDSDDDEEEEAAVKENEEEEEGEETREEHEEDENSPCPQILCMPLTCPDSQKEPVYKTIHHVQCEMCPRCVGDTDP